MQSLFDGDGDLEGAKKDPRLKKQLVRVYDVMATGEVVAFEARLVCLLTLLRLQHQPGCVTCVRRSLVVSRLRPVCDLIKTCTSTV